MTKFILGLVTAIVLAQAPAFGSVPPTILPGANLVTGFVDVGNRSDKCAYIVVDQKVGTGPFYLQPGADKHVILHWGGNPKVVADVLRSRCTLNTRVVQRYDYVPFDGKSQLTIHKQGATYIMRHGP